MANYNTRIEYLREAIDSILNQTFSDFEFIIIDDGSTDDSLKFIKAYNDDRIVIIENTQNLGLTTSLNIGLSLANGKYIARMDSDDVSLPERFEKQVKFMDENPDVIVCGTWFEKFGVENIVRKPVIDNFEYYRCQLLFRDTPITICHPSAMLRASMLKENSIQYDERYPKAQDYAMWALCSRYGRIDILHEVLLRYRTHESQISVAGVSKQEKCSVEICKDQLSLLGINDFANIKDFRNCNIKTAKEAKRFSAFLKSIRQANLKEKQYEPKQLKLYTDSMIERVIKNRDVGLLKLVFIGGFVYLNGLIRLSNKKLRGHSDVC